MSDFRSVLPARTPTPSNPDGLRMKFMGQQWDRPLIPQTKSGPLQQAGASVEVLSVFVDQDDGEFTDALAKPVESQFRRALLEFCHECGGAIGLAKADQC